MVSCLTYFRVEFSEGFCVKDFCESLKLTKNEVDYSSEKKRLIIGRNERFNINVNEMLRVTLKDLLGKEELLFTLKEKYGLTYYLERVPSLSVSEVNPILSLEEDIIRFLYLTKTIDDLDYYV